MKNLSPNLKFNKIYKNSLIVVKKNNQWLANKINPTNNNKKKPNNFRQIGVYTQ